MTDGTDDPGSGPSPQTKRLVGWRKAVRLAATEDRRLSILERAEHEQRIAGEYDNPWVVWIGLAVVVLLVVLGWVVIDALQCDPFFSDLGMARDRACR